MGNYWYYCIGHYDSHQPPTHKLECSSCETEFEYTGKQHTAPDFCNTCSEILHDPDNVKTKISVDVDMATKEIEIIVDLINNNLVDFETTIRTTDETENTIGIVGYLRLEAGEDAESEVVWLQDSHVVDAGDIKIRGLNDNTRRDNKFSQSFTWSEEGVVQEQVPTRKYEGEIGQDFRDRVEIHSGNPFNANEITIVFTPTSDVFDRAEKTVEIPGYKIDL